jgi:hypothetical protein
MLWRGVDPDSNTFLSFWNEMSVGARTDVAPASTVIDGPEALFVFAKTSGGRIIFNQAIYGGAFLNFGNDIPALLTDKPVAATTLGNTILVFAKATDQHIFVSKAVYGQAFTPWKELPALITDSSLTVTSKSNGVFTFAGETDQRIFVAKADFN